MKAFTAASLLYCFILQWLSKLWDLLCELCVCLQIYMLKFTWYQSLGGQGTSPPQISYWIIFLFCRYNFEMISSLINWLNKSDGAFGAICLALSPSLYYLIGSPEYPKDLWTKLDRTFGKHNEDHNITLEITSSMTRVLYSKFLTSTLSDEVV